MTNSKSPSVESYIPDSFFRRGKEELGGRICREDICLLDPSDNNRILAARGSSFTVGARLSLDAEEQAFLAAALSKEQTAALPWRDGVLIFFPSLLGSCGLIPVLRPHGTCEDIAFCLPHMNRPNLMLSPALLEAAKHGRGDETLYGDLCEQFILCRQILHPEQDVDFRLHSAYIAQFAGYRADVTALPLGSYPITGAEMKRWTGFLLCTFLALRSLSVSRADLTMDGATRSEFSLRLAQNGRSTDKKAPTDDRFSYLSLPAFSDYRLTQTDRGLLLEIKLRRRAAEAILRAFPEEMFGESLCMEILFDL